MKPETKAAIDDLSALHKKYLSSVRKGFDKVLTAIAKEVFDLYPGVQAIGWSQYTPYFNDGDPCVFRVGCPTIKVDEQFAENFEPVLSEYAEDFYEVSSYSVKNNPNYTSILDLGNLLTSLEGLLGTFENFVQEEYGDGVWVTITRDGVEVTEYRHD